MSSAYKISIGKSQRKVLLEKTALKWLIKKLRVGQETELGNEPIKS